MTIPIPRVTTPLRDSFQMPISNLPANHGNNGQAMNSE